MTTLQGILKTESGIPILPGVPEKAVKDAMAALKNSSAHRKIEIAIDVPGKKILKAAEYYGGECGPTIYQGDALDSIAYQIAVLQHSFNGLNVPIAVLSDDSVTSKLESLINSYGGNAVKSNAIKQATEEHSSNQPLVYIPEYSPRGGIIGWQKVCWHPPNKPRFYAIIEGHDFKTIPVFATATALSKHDKIGLLEPQTYVAIGGTVDPFDDLLPTILAAYGTDKSEWSRFNSWQWHMLLKEKFRPLKE